MVSKTQMTEPKKYIRTYEIIEAAEAVIHEFAPHKGENTTWDRLYRAISLVRRDIEAITKPDILPERQDMTDDEYARAEKAAERKRDAAEDWE